MIICPLIEADELLSVYKQPDVLIFDAGNGPHARADYEAEHLENAVFVDVDTQLAHIGEDAAVGGRHPLPSVTDFANTLSDLGISRGKHIVVYDNNSGANAAARFWWMLKSAGHQKVQVLNGGLAQAKRHGFPLRTGSEMVRKAMEPYLVSDWGLPTVTIEEVEKASQDPDYLVVDVRDKIRYDGISEPIDLVAGHIPGAINIPFRENLDGNGLFLKPDELRDKYQARFSNVKAEYIMVHCGSGITACHTLLALAYAGMEIPNLYVGSWSEWSRGGKKIAGKKM